MKVYTDKKKLEFVYPASESQMSLQFHLSCWRNTIYFVNEHGGWTDEFRYTYMDPRTRTVRFRLFLHGLPVYADSSLSTEIVQKWGKNGIFSYTRPYYTLSDVCLNRNLSNFPSGLDVAERLMESDNLEFDTVEEISQVIL